MKILIVVLALYSLTSSFALSTPDAVVFECKRQMSAGICMTRQDRSALSPGRTMILSGVGKVSLAAYLDYVDLYNPQNPIDPAMCNLAGKYMLEQPNGDHAKIARALWTPTGDEIIIKTTLGVDEVFLKIALITLVAIIGFRLTTLKQGKA